MRIISSFKDYYDSVHIYTQDDSAIYVRKEKEFRIKNKILKSYFEGDCEIPEKYRFYTRNNYENNINSALILFCNKIYPVLWYHVWGTVDANGNMADKIAEKINIYSEKDFDKEIKKAKKRDRDIKASSFSAQKRNLFNNTLKFKKSKNIFIDYSSPIIIIYPNALYTKYNWFDERESKVELNPKLDNFDFARMIDVYTAYQEVDQFVSCVLPIAANPTVEVEDKYKIGQHGYDKKSFRRQVHPGKPRGRK